MYLRLNDLYQDATAIPLERHDPLRKLFHDKADAFSSAAMILGGSRGAALVDAIVEGLRRPGAPGRGTRTALRRLLGLLSLENTHDETRPEAAMFASIDPADPLVEEICLLTDDLRDAIDRADAAPAPAPRLGLSCNSA